MQAILKIAKNLFAQLEKKEILHCHWKSNQHLMDALSGLTDIDLLAETTKVHEVESILLQLGFKKVVSQSWCRYPGLDDWIGFDYDSGRLVHIHLHFQLLMGLGFKVSGFSAAAGQRSGQFDQYRNFSFAGFTKSEYRISNHEYQMSKECILPSL